MPEITPSLWFDDQAEEAVDFNLAILPTSRVNEVSRRGQERRRPLQALRSNDL